MASKKSSNGDSKQGLIITLVCFIVLSLGLGVAAYYGYADNATDKKTAQTAKTDLESMKKNREYYKYNFLQLKELVGVLDPKEASDLSGLASQNTTGEDKALQDTMFADLRKRLATANNASETLEKKVARLTKELESAKALYASTDLDLKRAVANLKKTKDDNDAEAKNWKDKLDAALAQNVKERQDQEAKFAQALGEFGDLNKKLVDLAKKAEEDQIGNRKVTKTLTNEINLLRLKLVKLQDAMKPVDYLKFDTPKGQIVRLDQKGEVAWINLGSADNLRANQSVTFSVFSATTGGKIGGERKGALEVVAVQGPHLAEAKITDVADPSRDPIVTGDLLINPAWSPSNRTHVAIAGLIDMTGEGRDQIDEFLRTLRREGIVVDAYLDLRDLETKGEGMTLKTDYLIVGEEPNLNASITTLAKAAKGSEEGKDEPQGEDPRFARNKAIASKMSEMRHNATELGITVLPLRRFAVLTGFRLPKGVGVGTGAGFDFIRQSDTFAAPDKAPAKNGKGAAKPEKKEKDEDDKEKEKEKDK